MTYRRSGAVLATLATLIGETRYYTFPSNFVMSLVVLR